MLNLKKFVASILIRRVKPEKDAREQTYQKLIEKD